jgi:hypothetical protein
MYKQSLRWAPAERNQKMDTQETEIVSVADLRVLRPLEAGDTDMRQYGARRRLKLAYGKWTITTGREVIYNRRYRPIWERTSANEPWNPANIAEWVHDIEKQEWFYHDGHRESQKTRLASKAMQELGIPLPPPWKGKAQCFK